MKGNYINYIPIFATLLVVCGCANHSRRTLAEDLQLRDSAASATREAGRFLADLHRQGKLPGLSKDDHGELKAEVSDFSKTVHFPLLLSFRFLKSDASVYHYTAERLSTSSDWRLVRAWQTDAADKLVGEFPLP